MSAGALLLVAHSFPPDNTAGAARPARFCKFLPGFGWEVDVITAAAQREPAEGVHCVPNPIPGWQRRLWRLGLEPGVRQWTRDVMRIGAALASRRHYRAVLSTSPQLTPHLAAYRLKRRCGMAWIADLRDPIVGNPGRRRPLPRLLDPACERGILEHADLVVANTDAAAHMLRERHPRHAAKIHVIWNGYDPTEAVDARPLPPRRRRVMLHVGEVYQARHPGPVLRALERLVAAGEIAAGGLLIRLVGATPEETGEPEWYREAAARGAVEFTPRVSRSAATAEAAAADYLLLVDMRAQTPTQIPSKLFDYIRTGRPILALTMPGSPSEWVLDRAGVPHRVLYWDRPVEKHAAVLGDFLKLPAEAVQPSDWFFQMFDGRAQAGALARLMDAL